MPNRSVSPDPPAQGASAAPEPRPWVFWFYCAIFILIMVVASSPSPLYPVYQEKFGFSGAVLTIVFAVYVIGMLAAMLTAGSLSEFAGRKPLMAGGLALLAAALVMFAFASSTGWLIAARTVQGIATGILSATIGAAMLDTQPAHPAGRAALMNAVAPSIGLAGGGLLSGAFVEFLPAPTSLVYWTLLGALTLSAIPLFWLPETAPMLPGALQSLIPRASIPRHLRAVMLVAAPCLAACWGTGGLYLALGPSMVKSLLNVDNHLVGGFAICALWVPGLIAPFLARSWTYYRMLVLGSASMLVGVIGIVVAFRLQLPWLFFTSTALTGLGFGVLFTASYGTVANQIRPGERAQVVATIFVLSYLAFSVPVVVAGFLVNALGLQTASELVAGWIGLQAALALIAVVVSHRRSNRRAPGTPSA